LAQFFFILLNFGHNSEIFLVALTSEQTWPEKGTLDCFSTLKERKKERKKDPFVVKK
jgi:hypothetical protein